MTVDSNVVDAVVSRLREVHGLDDPELRAHAAQVWAEFEDVPVQVYVPVLVEKRLREYARLRRRAAAVLGRPTT